MNKGIVLGLVFLLIACVAVGSYVAFFRDVIATRPGVTCQVHNLPLEDGRVPIKYGLMRFTGVEINARQKLFPHAASFYGGGCVVGSFSPGHAWVSFCPECRKAEAAWMENRDKQVAPVRAHLERVRAVLKDNPKFQGADAFMDGEVPTVGIEGKVRTEADLAELQRLVEATAPPNPVAWKVGVGP